jgi:ankyrin repeat protein
MVVLGLATAAEGHVNAFRKLRRAVYNVYYGLVGAASRTPLTLAAFRGHVDVVRELLEVKNVDVNQVDNMYDQTPLSCAAEKGHVEVVRVLLEAKNVDVNKVDINDQTPLYWATSCCQMAMIKALIDVGAEPVDPDRLKPLTRTVRYQVIKFLNVKPEWYDSAVGWAAYFAMGALNSLLFLCMLPFYILFCICGGFGPHGPDGVGGGGRSGGGHGGP